MNVGRDVGLDVDVTLDVGLLDVGRWDVARWTPRVQGWMFDLGRCCTLLEDVGRSAVGLWTLDVRRWMFVRSNVGRWALALTLDVGCWTWDIGRRTFEVAC